MPEKVVAVGLALVLLWWLAPVGTGGDGADIAEAVSVAEMSYELNNSQAESASPAAVLEQYDANGESPHDFGPRR